MDDHRNAPRGFSGRAGDEPEGVVQRNNDQPGRGRQGNRIDGDLGWLGTAGAVWNPATGKVRNAGRVGDVGKKPVRQGRLDGFATKETRIACGYRGHT